MAERQAQESIRSLIDVDPAIHAPARLTVMTYLYVVESADFVFLKNMTGLTWGNLSTHLSKLETAGYVALHKTFQGKKVSLPGTFVHFANKDHGYLTVKMISTQGVSFETKSNSAINIDDMLNIEFTLDNAKRTRIKRQVSIQAIDENYYESIFYNPPPYDKDLGFYLIG